MSESQKIPRPLSPHLQVYKLPLTALMSISHRITGNALAAGTWLVLAVLISAAMGEGPYTFVMGLADSAIGRLVMFAWSFALYFHMCNGVRHMIWDTGACLDKKTAMQTNYYVLFFTLVLTAATWFLAAGFSLNAATGM